MADRILERVYQGRDNSFRIVIQEYDPIAGTTVNKSLGVFTRFIARLVSYDTGAVAVTIDTSSNATAIDASAGDGAIDFLFGSLLDSVTPGLYSMRLMGINSSAEEYQLTHEQPGLPSVSVEVIDTETIA